MKLLIIILSLLKIIDISFDSCSVINLINCKQLENVFKIPNYNFHIGLSVYDELCKVGVQAEILNDSIKKGALTLFKSDVDLELVEKLYSQYNLGDGETEALAICIENSFKMC